jgi:hypothetical protein
LHLIKYLIMSVYCRDQHGFIKPRIAWRDSGNGTAYTSLDVLFQNFFFSYRNPRSFTRLIEKVFNGGLLYRTPEHTYGQQSWDDYAMLACACITLGVNWIPIVVMTYGAVNFGFFDTDGVDAPEDWLGRFVHVWLFMAAGTFWVAKWLLLPAISVAVRFIKGDDWKVWAFHETYRVMYGIKTAEHRRVTALMPTICEAYFGPDHCFTELWKSSLTPAHVL